MRRKTTQEERYAEVEWKYVTPLMPRAESGLKEIEQEPMLQAGENETINRKLREIIFDHVEFDAVSLPAVVRHLKQRSRELDPEGKGVNIFLRLGGGKSKASKKSSGGSPFGDEDVFGPGGGGPPGGAPSEEEPEEDIEDDSGGDGDFGGDLATTVSVPDVTLSVDN
ncbi:MAG TPA: hypothetical protein P5125_03960, partial [Kiritimatiellia bacterium]|nr:hypothetical protein [Kiritimatiellia bacterium]